METFKVINEYPNYAVSNLGNIKNIKKDKLMKLTTNSKNVVIVNLRVNKVAKTVQVSKLVEQYFKEELYEESLPGFIKTPFIDDYLKSTLKLGVETKEEYLFRKEVDKAYGIDDEDSLNVKAYVKVPKTEDDIFNFVNIYYNLMGEDIRGKDVKDYFRKLFIKLYKFKHQLPPVDKEALKVYNKQKDKIDKVIEELGLKQFIGCYKTEIIFFYDYYVFKPKDIIYKDSEEYTDYSF